MIGHQQFERFGLGLRDHEDHHGLAGPGIGGEPPKIGNDLRVVHGHELLGDAVALGEGVRKTGRRRERRECRDPFAPGVARSQRHFDFGDDAVDAIGVHHLENVAPAQLDDAGMLLNGDDFDRKDGAGIGDLSPGAGAGAGRAAGDEAADGRVLARGRVEAQLVCGGRERAIDVEHARAGAETSGTRPVPDHLIEPGHIEHDPARERHRLAVISGSAAAHGERHPVPGAGRGEAHHVGLVAWHHDDVGALVVQCLLENRREPEEIAAFHPQRSRVFQNRNVAQVLTK